MTTQTPSPVRRIISNAIDIAIVAVFTFAAAIALEAFAPPQVPFAQLIPLLGQPLAVVAFIWLLLRLRGQHLSDIGLGRVKSLKSTFLQAVALAVILFAIAWITEAMGFARDFSSVRARLEGQPLNLLFFIIYAFVGAGLYEEVTFRGLTLDRFLRMFGASPLAWPIAALAQGLLFGLAHTHQGPFGILYTGVLGALFALVLTVNGRNLWALVLGHGLYDASRFVYFYWLWTYGA
jgi:hypothetical protein